MPDWSYHSLLRPLAFRLPAEQGRDITLWATATLEKLPLGPVIIEAFGHMRPSPQIKRAALGITFASPVGLGAGIDAHAVALRGLARFGFGYLELGPVTLAPVTSTAKIERRPEHEAIWYPAEPVNDGFQALLRRIEQAAPLPVPLAIRLGHRPGASPQEAARERSQMLRRLQPYAAFFTLETQGPAADGSWSTDEWAEHLDDITRALEACPPQRPLLLCLAPDLAPQQVQALLEPALEHGISGVVVTGGVQASAHGWMVGAPARRQSLELVESLHRSWGDRLTIIGSGGIHEPADALRLLQAGATLIQVESGLVYAGPGLPKRINEALAFYTARPHSPGAAARLVDTQQKTQPRSSKPRRRLPFLFRERWFWMALIGASMIFGGILATLIAATLVVLPYDEAFVGLMRSQLTAINPHLLQFMAHDRVSLAGVMISIGVLYWQLAVFGIRQGQHWAWSALLVSDAVGSATFFLFLGFGYFDPLHACVSIILLGFFLLALRGRALSRNVPSQPDLHNDRAWRLSQWGQSLFILLGVGIIGAGVVIASLGVTAVFVNEDLAFMGTTAANLHAANQHLVPLIAHDRAGLGGALVSDGLAVLLSSLWGFQRGNRWLWWMLLGAGVPAIGAALTVHLVVGYTNLFHLAPVLALLVLFPLALALCYPYLCCAAPASEYDQKRYQPLIARQQQAAAVLQGKIQN